MSCLFMQSRVTTVQHTVVSHQSAERGDAKTLGKGAAGFVAIHVNVQQEPVKVLSHCCSFIQFKNASAA